MPALRILKLGEIRGLGLFKDYRASGSSEFRKYNLVYGFNGSGKTTLSRIFASLGSGERNPNLPEDGSFEVCLSDGTQASSDGDLSSLRGRVLVFNTDFVDESFQWKKGEARPVFYIGKEQADLAEQLTRVGAEIEKAELEQRSLQEQERAAERAFGVYKRNLARQVADELGLGRRYDASNLSADYANRPEEGYKPLSQDVQTSVRSVLAQSQPLARLTPITAWNSVLTALGQRCSERLSESVGKMVAGNLRGHDAMRDWLRRGLKYHDSHSLSNCLLCGNEFSIERRAELSKVIDSKYEEMIGNLEELKAQVDTMKSTLREVESQLPRAGEFGPDQTGIVSDKLAAVMRATKGGLEFCSTINNLIEQKLGAPHRIFDREQLALAKPAQELDGELGAALSALSDIVIAHNADVDSFDRGKVDAANQLKCHLLAEGESGYIELDNTLAHVRRAREGADSRVSEFREEEQRLRDSLRSHGPAAERINKMIHNYLGRRDLELVTSDDGYRLRRNGRLVRGSLSEGEKTAIAICYFITTLEAEGRKRGDLIVVIDDPVSSLDTRALNYSFNVLRAMVDGACQVFLLTHNLQFMNEVKKWLFKNTTAGPRRVHRDEGAASATLLFLDVTQSAGPETRACRLSELPKYIRDYESEYHYLLSLIFKFLSVPNASEYFFLMPNAMRKVLDIFLAFKVPGPEGLGSKVRKIARESTTIDASRIYALEALAQVESHADNLDELVSFSTATVEEVRDAAETLLELMSMLDRSHFNAMRALCS